MQKSSPTSRSGEVRHSGGVTSSGAVDLYWLPLGAGGGNGCVRSSGRLYEAAAAARDRRAAQPLFHAALEVATATGRSTVEMAPVWGNERTDRGVVAEGPVGLRLLGRSRWFRYEVRCWRDGRIPDAVYAVDSPRRLSTSASLAGRLLAQLPAFPTATWGRDEQRTGDMWNSNSLIAWLLVRAGLAADLEPPRGGRAPGWTAGRVVAERTGRS